MPELPEVEVVAAELRTELIGRRLGRPHIRKAGVVEPAKGLKAGSFAGRRVEGVRRRGKLLILDVEGDGAITVHLRMTGRLWLAREEPSPPHTHVRFPLDDGRELRFRDPRRFGRIGILRRTDLEALPFLLRLGPEPFELDAEELGERLARRPGPVKGALLNQSVVAGLGNIYVDEVLFLVGIHPLRPANRLTADERVELVKAMRLVLRSAIEAGGSTIRDYLPVSPEPGRYQLSHWVFGRGGQPCLRCGKPVRKIRVVGRGTHFCPTCQPRRRRRRLKGTAS